MTVQQLLVRLRELDVDLWVEGSKLRYSAPADVLTDELISDLASHKEEIIEWLNKAVSDSLSAIPDIQPVSRDHDLPASFSQERLLFI